MSAPTTGAEPASTFLPAVDIGANDGMRKLFTLVRGDLNTDGRSAAESANFRICFVQVRKGRNSWLLDEGQWDAIVERLAMEPSSVAPRCREVSCDGRPHR
jgi:hypothetical protein